MINPCTEIDIPGAIDLHGNYPAATFEVEEFPFQHNTGINLNYTTFEYNFLTDPMLTSGHGRLEEISVDLQVNEAVTLEISLVRLDYTNVRHVIATQFLRLTAYQSISFLHRFAGINFDAGDNFAIWIVAQRPAKEVTLSSLNASLTYYTA